jgi:hypothetical protein
MPHPFFWCLQYATLLTDLRGIKKLEEEGKTKGGVAPFCARSAQGPLRAKKVHTWIKGLTVKTYQRIGMDKDGSGWS